MAKSKTTNLPPEITARFPDLTEAQYRLLCWCAYFGETPKSVWTMEKYDGAFGVRKGQTSQNLAVLKNAGYLPGEKIAPGKYFEVTLTMLKHFPQWEQAFEKLNRYRDDIITYLWKVSKCISAGDLTPAKSLRYPTRGSIWQYFLPIVFRKDCNHVMGLLPEDNKATLLSFALERSLAFDTISEKLVEKVSELASTWMRDPSVILDQATAFSYFATGILPVEKIHDDSQTLWSLALKGIGLLYKGEYAEALEAFLAALEKSDGLESRNCFRNPLLTWFYAVTLVCCCKKLRSHKARVNLDRLMGDSKFKFEALHSPARIFLTYYSSTEKKCDSFVTSELLSMQKENRSVLASHLGNLVARYFRVGDDNLHSLGYDVLSAPSALVLQNELSPFIPMTSSAKAALKETFGAGGSLSQIPRKENWEMALSGLTEQVVQNQNEEQTEKRIIYFLEDKWISAILEQSRPKDSEEEWGHDRLLSRSTFVKDGYDSMDVTDLKLAGALGRKVIDVPDIEVAVPILAGTGRLFTGQHYRAPYRQLEVFEEAPFVAFSGKDGFIEVSTNAGRTKEGATAASTIIPRDGGYVCIRTNPVQRDILDNLLGIGHFPVSAAPAIRRTIESLEGLITVKSSLADAAVIPTMKGSTRLALRITPDKEDSCYVMDLQTAPHEEGYLRCDPGQGSEDVYDDTGSEARFIRRDLQCEYDNYMELRDIAEKEWNLEFRTPTQCELWASESLLHVLVWAYENRDKCFVEWPEGRPLRFHGDMKASDIDITVKSNIEWFSVEGEVLIGRDKYNLNEILDAMRRSDVKGFIKLSDKDYVRMSKTLQKHLEDIDGMMNTKRGKERVVPVYRVGQLAKVLGDEGGLHATMDKGFTDLLDRMQQAYDSVPELPQGLKAELRDYQKDGYVWMKRLDAWGAGACLADDMGLGKTLQSLAFILSKASEGPSLVVAPKSVVPNWDIEAAKFTPTLRVTVLNSETDRSDCIANAGPNDLVLATYGVLGTESELLASREWNVVCLDEAHQIKNRNTRVSAAAMGLKARSRLILTGTPIQNHLGELWNLFQFINPGLLGQWGDFKGRYMGSATLDEENRGFLKDLVQPFILRRTKEEVLSELPEKMVYEQMVELSPEELQVYEAMRKNVEDHVKTIKKRNGQKEKDDGDGKIQFFAELTRLRLAACSMSLVHDDWQGGSSKTEALKGILDELSGNEGNRVLIFSQFTSYLGQVKNMLDKAGMRYLYLDGQTDLDERADLVTQFQNGDCPIFLVSLKAGGLGLNLTAANYVILLDPWWNPAIENQAMDRAHRLGQKRNVTVIRLISKHTIEEKILRLHETKQMLSDEIMDGTADSWHLTMDDILDMVSPFR